MSWQLIYWLTRLDSIRVGMFIVLVFLGIVALVKLFWSAHEFTECEEKKGKIVFRSAVRWLVAGITILLFTSLLPSTKEACAIYLIPKIANNEDVQKIPANVAKILNAQLEEWIDEQFGETENE